MNPETTMRRPPALANWLLIQAANEALAGDLTEEYSAGRPLSWYWREVVFAALWAAVASIRRHKLEALWATAAAWAFMTCWGLVATNVWREWHQSEDVTMVTRWIGYFVSGLIVGRFFRFPTVVAVLVPLAVGTALRYLGLVVAWMPVPMQPPVDRALDPALCILLGAAVAAWARTRDVATV